MAITYPEKIDQTLGDPNLQLAIYTATGRLMDKRKGSIDDDLLPDYQERRTRANLLKKHTIDNLDYYLELAEKNITSRGGKVVYCSGAEDVASFVINLAKERNAKLFVKSKSMTSEEIHFNDHLEKAGLEPVETDLGEYILQLAREKPYHIVAPALHYTRFDVAEIFERMLGVENETVIEKQTMIARRVLREKFLKADIGVTGANFVVADSGAVVVVENEGNARLSSSTPRIHIAIAGLEKLIPRAQDLPLFLSILGRSATGQPLTVYTSFLNGPRRDGEVDGPDEFYLIFLDNGRTKLLENEERRQSLYCIRCGACLNHCPVYRKIGGHSYPWVYSGPIGAVITPQYMGVRQDPWLPFASSLCGACAEVCPVKIDIPKLLLDLRRDVVESKTQDGSNRLEKLAFRLWAWVMQRPAMYDRLSKAAALLAPSGQGPSGWIRTPGLLSVGPVKQWVSERDLPPPAPKSFRQLWRERKKPEAK